MTPMSNKTDAITRTKSYRRKIFRNRSSIQKKYVEISKLKRQIERLEKANSRLTSIRNSTYGAWSSDFNKIKSMRYKDFKGDQRTKFNNSLARIEHEAKLWENKTGDQSDKIRNRIVQLRNEVASRECDISNLRSMISIYESMVKTLEG